MCRRAAWILLVLLLPAFASAAPSAVRVGREPAWVQPVPVADSVVVPRGRVSGLYALLLDIQSNQALPTPEVYRHSARLVVNEEGVAAASQVTVEFHPGDQQLTFHRVAIHRGGRILDRLDASRIRVLQRETGLEWSLYVGTQTALLLLDDVRPGDIVEVSYTLRGENSVYAGHFGVLWNLGWSEPVRMNRHRLLWPAHRHLSYRLQHAEEKSEVRRGPGVLDYAWTVENAPVVEQEDNLPSWYDPFPRLQLSDFQNWGEVARWGAKLYETPAAPAGSLREKLEAIRSANPQQEQRALAAIRFVQDDIRYLGIELGENSHRPASPERVLAQRFGDCKDKALLLVTLLRGLGYEAEPALVSTDLRGEVRNWLPSIFDFDHVIVRFSSGDSAHWVDATQQAERCCSLVELDVPDFGCALVLSDTTTGLSPVCAPPAARGRTAVFRTFDAHKLDAPALLTVQTTYQGRAANAMRGSLRRESRNDLAKRYREFYVRAYHDVEAVRDPAIEDDETENMITVTENYRIPNFWSASAASKKRVARFDAIELTTDLPRVEGVRRAMPLGLGDTRHMVCDTHALMPDGWSAPQGSLKISNDAVTLHSRISSDEHTLDIHEDFEVRQDFLPADKAKAANADFDAIDAELIYATYPGRNRLAGGGSRINWMAVLVCVIAGAFAIWGARWFPRQPIALANGQGLFPVAVSDEANDSPAPESPESEVAPEPGAPPESEPQEPLPIGGWLILMGVGVVVVPLQRLYVARWSWRLVEQGYWDKMVSYAHSTVHNVGFLPLLLAELAGSVVLEIWSVGLVLLFFQRRRAFPRAWMATVLAGVLYALGDHASMLVLQLATNGSTTALVRMLMFSVSAVLIWGRYLHVSRRVARTFVR